VSDILGPLGALAFMVWIIWVIMTGLRKSRIIKAQIGIREKILEKIGSGQEMMDFMKSEAGKGMLEPLPTETTTPQGFSRILRAMQAGVILAVLGAGILLLNSAMQVDEEVTMLGGLVLALGIGFLLAAAASYVLSKNWGLLNRPESE